MPEYGKQVQSVSRREALALAGAAFVALLPHIAHADPGAVAALLKKLYGARAMIPAKIKLVVPEIAENGLVVPIDIEVESAMTGQDFVKAVHVFADGNRLPGVVSYRFTAEAGKAAVSTRMRLAQSQNIVCVAEMSNGALHSAMAAVKVTTGGCGG